jgi:hypothetical protein
MNMNHSLLTIEQFQQHEPRAVPSIARAYQIVRELPPGVKVQIGRRIFIDWAAWEHWKSSGGRQTGTSAA